MRSAIAAPIALVVSHAPTATCSPKKEKVRRSGWRVGLGCVVVEISRRTVMLSLQWGVLP